MDEQSSASPGNVSRRDFMRSTAVAVSAGAAVLVSGARLVHAAGSGKIRIGLVGCGGRGTGAAFDCMSADPALELYAMADVFQDRLDGAYRSLSRGRGGRHKRAGLGHRMNVTPERMFVGFDAYRELLQTDVDLVLNATPPHFRPEHLMAAIEAGKHAFVEKPVAVDPAGVRKVIAASELAEKKGLAIVCGTQRRHTPAYIETMQRIHEGQIGDLVAAQCYWNMGGLWAKHPRPEWTPMEVQLRNWLYYTWLSGDHIVEQHVHNIDVVNWAFGGPPRQCMGIGGRQSRISPVYGNIFDHFAIEYQYENGARVMSMCRQAPGASGRVGERIVGTKGVAVPGRITGENPWRFTGKNANGQRQEHADLVKGIREGKPLNEGKRIAESTLTAIVGRMSAYTGREMKLSWALKVSKLDLAPPRYEFGDVPAVLSEVAVPGKTKLV